MKQIQLSLIFNLLIQFHLAAGKVTGDISPIFDISPDGKTMALSIGSDVESNLFLYSFETRSLTQITNKKNAYYSRPMFSPDGKNIVFLNKDIKNEKSRISILDITTGSIQSITTSVDYVTEAIFHPDGEKILFCGANFIGSYSPLAQKAPHDIDLYSINLNSENEIKITEFHAYELSAISANKTGDQIVFECTKKDRFEGIYSMEIADTANVVKLEVTNNPRTEIGAYFYGSPCFSSDNSSIAFIAPYQVYTMDLSQKTCKIAWDNTKQKDLIMAIHARFKNADEQLVIAGIKIVDRKYASSAEFYIVNLSNGLFEELKLK